MFGEVPAGKFADAEVASAVAVVAEVVVEVIRRCLPASTVRRVQQ